MHEHDIDLIMALAEGTLGESDAAAAHARIAACEQCLEDLKLNRAALGALREAPRVYLTATESAGLRSTLRAELGLEGSAKTAPRRPRRLAFGALAGAAAVLLAVVVAGPALDLFGSESSPTGDVALAPLAPELEQADAVTGAAAETPAPPGDLASPGLPAPVPAPVADGGSMHLAGDTDLAALKSSIIEEGVILATSRFAEPTSSFGDQSTPEAGEPPAAPNQDESPVELTALAPGCDPESLAVAPSESVAEIVATIDFEGKAGLVVFFRTDPVEDSVLVVVDAALCEVLATE